MIKSAFKKRAVILLRGIVLIIILLSSLLVSFNNTSISYAASPPYDITVTRTLPSYVYPGEILDVMVTFTSPIDNFIAIGLSDFAPVGWTVAVNNAWNSPSSDTNKVTANRADYIWFGPFTSGTEFTVVYQVTVPANATQGTYYFTNSLLTPRIEYYIAGEGPYYGNIGGQNQVIIASPTITGSSPASGPLVGGTPVAITGNGFISDHTTITIGGIVATGVTFVSESSLTAVTPASTTGGKNVAVTTPVGSATLIGGFTYLPPPTIASFIPGSGGSGTAVVITGTNLSGATMVSFGGAATSSFTVNSNTQITAVLGIGNTGTVSVTTRGGTATSTGSFTWVAAPTVASISPSSGPPTGGTSITIIGTGFVSGVTVTIGGTAATGVIVASPTSITAVTPVGTAGLQNVVITTPGGSATLAGGFTYVAAVSGGGPGGGGGPPPITLTPTQTPTPTPTPVSGTGSAYVGGIITTTGVFTQPATLQSSNGIATVNIAAGTSGTLNGAPLGKITVALQATPPPPPTISNVIGVAYDFGPNGAVFNPPISMTISYNPANILSGVLETNLVLAFYDTVTGQWITIPGGVVDTIKHTITVPVSHFTLFTAIAPSATPTPTPTSPPSPTPTASPMPTATPTIIPLPTTPAVQPTNSIPATVAQTVTAVSTPVTKTVPAKSIPWTMILVIIVAVVMIGVVGVIFVRRRS